MSPMSLPTLGVGPRFTGTRYAVQSQPPVRPAPPPPSGQTPKRGDAA